jgi:hypothetical protein
LANSNLSPSARDKDWHEGKTPTPALNWPPLLAGRLILQ